MAKNKLRKLIYLIGILLSIYLSVYVFKLEVGTNEVEKFSKSFFELISNILIILLMIYLVYYQFVNPKENESAPLNFIIIGFLSVFVLIIMTNFFVNPRGIYGPSIFPTLVTNLRNKKVNDFENLKETPDILIVGSSRALSINPDYIEEKTGLSSYNFGVTGTYLDEYLVILKYIYDHDKLDPPKVILIDRLGFSVSPGMTASRAPFQFFPYLDEGSSSKILFNRISELSTIHQFTESLYVLQFFAFTSEYQPTWTVSDNGFGLPNIKEPLSEAIGDSISVRVDRKPCDIYYPDESIPILEEMVALAEENNSTILFYTSPNQPAYTTRLRENIDQNLDVDDEPTCGQVISDFYKYLEQDYQHVHSVQFFHPDDFNGFSDERGYFDGTHMTETNSNLLVDALSESLINAYQESIQRRDSLITP